MYSGLCGFLESSVNTTMIFIIPMRTCEYGYWSIMFTLYMPCTMYTYVWIITELMIDVDDIN